MDVLDLTDNPEEVARSVTENLLETDSRSLDYKDIVRRVVCKLELNEGALSHTKDFEYNRTHVFEVPDGSGIKYTVRLEYGTCYVCDTLKSISMYRKEDPERRNRLFRFVLHVLQSFQRTE
jgi:hypothetical protein